MGMGVALDHIYLLALGEFDTDSYSYGMDGKTASDYVNFQRFLINFYFIIATFIFLIHLMNMLIAIMGETFGKNNEI